MPIELTLLALTVLLGAVHILATAHVRTKQYGVAWNMGARDAAMPEPAPLVGRLARAQANFFETFPLFAVALLGAVVAGRLGWKTEVGAHLYFWARVAYLPVYAAGIPKLRTAIFGVSFLGFVLVVAALLFG
ncbi:MAPEG family protein [Sphingomonas montana]|uniref:MAPEG family protein n=1 Tax=Sphingomonas montana TaxID=1843236 RepID=UPI00096C695D|nr:MAPEG family protein [Sphingomonas montana]